MAKKNIYNIDNGRGNMLSVPCVGVPHCTKMVFDIYENFNKEIFDKDVSCPIELKEMVDLVYNAHKQEYNSIVDIGFKKHNTVSNINKSKICLGFSGGLDSVYHAFVLRDAGYDVVLFHVVGINTYENGQGTKYSKIFADKFGFEYVEGFIKKTMDKSNVYKQYWPENPIKNQLILSMMIDWCMENGCTLLSLGDDFDLSICDAAVGINLTDSQEITKSFMSGITKLYPGFEFVPIKKGNDKSKRLKLLKDKGAIDIYYSCVLPGRFNKSRHKSNIIKYGIELPENNCGCSCRKCAMHNLIMYYSDMVVYPDDFIDACWNVMWNNAHSADYVFFSPDIPLDKRIDNLFAY